MKICLIINKERPHSKKIINFVKKKFNYITIIDVSFSKKKLTKIYNKKFDYVISYLCPFKIDAKFLKKTKFYNINFHPGPPKYPGFGCYNYAIFNQDKQYSCVAHLMNNKIDNGIIFHEEKFILKKKISLEDLIKQSNKVLCKLALDVLQKISSNKLQIKKIANWSKQKYTKNFLNNKISTLNFKVNQKLFNRFLRATINLKLGYPLVKINGHKFRYEKN